MCVCVCGNSGSKVSLVCQQTSPVVPGDYEDSSLPVCLFRCPQSLPMFVGVDGGGEGRGMCRAVHDLCVHK